jgi:hypothetical protein
MTIDYKALAAQAAEMEDQTDTQAGGDFEYQVAPEGITFGRMIEYIELGKQKQRAFQGKPKKDADEVRITFELLHPKKNIREIEVDGKKIQVTDRISINTTKSLHEKSGYVKLFKAMARGREDIKHMAQMLNEAFLLTVSHNVKEKDGKKTTYANLQKDGVYNIAAPVIVDPVAETTTQIPVPAALSPIRIFLWNNPTKETWDTLFIDGDKTVKDEDGSEKQVSKNWLQNRILGATNFAGSALEDLLSGSAELEAAIGEAEPEAKPAKTDTQKAAPAKKSATASSVKTTAKASSPTPKAKAAPVDEDPLAKLGL